MPRGAKILRLHVIIINYKYIKQKMLSCTWAKLKYYPNKLIIDCACTFNSLRTDGVTPRDRNFPKNLRLSKPTDMTIHLKALEEHFLMVPLFVQFSGGKPIF
jgi:hypothetical protein